MSADGEIYPEGAGVRTVVVTSREDLEIHRQALDVLRSGSLGDTPTDPLR